MNLSYTELRRDLAAILSRFIPPREAQAESWRWLEEGIGKDRTWLISHGEEHVSEDVRVQIGHWLRQRREGMPWVYLLGWVMFGGRRFEVSRDTLIPRPETELLVEAALDIGRRLGIHGAVDVGTGTGIIAISLALESPWKITATDLSDAALAVAQKNAKALGATLTFVQGDLLAPMPDPVGLVVSNPPYVALEESGSLQRELGFEPPIALFSKDGGLYHATEILRQAKERQAPACILEIGAGQGEELQQRAHGFGWKKVAVHQDLNGFDRILVALG